MKQFIVICNLLLRHFKNRALISLNLLRVSCIVALVNAIDGRLDDGEEIMQGLEA